MADRDPSKDDKKSTITKTLKDLGFLPKDACQLILHCVDGKVQAVELGKLKLA